MDGRVERRTERKLKVQTDSYTGSDVDSYRYGNKKADG
jgi:hypothetical protein